MNCPLEKTKKTIRAKGKTEIDTKDAYGQQNLLGKKVEMANRGTVVIHSKNVSQFDRHPDNFKKKNFTDR